MRLLVFCKVLPDLDCVFFAKSLIGVAAKCGLCVTTSFAEKPNAPRKETNKSLPKHNNTHGKHPAQ